MEGLFDCVSPRDLNSHGTLLREPENSQQEREAKGKNAAAENESKEK